jgi:hypothetical protein
MNGLTKGQQFSLSKIGRDVLTRDTHRDTQ